MNKKDLLQKIKTLDTLSKDEKAILVELLNAKKYGLVWENKPEAVEELLRQNLPILKEVKEKYIKGTNTPQIPKNDLFPTTENTPTTPQNNPNHLLIEGDNLHALTALSFTHENKIDVIYIDPPYNTGNKDFKYNDSFVDKEDTYRHSKWLSFMSKRLQIAKKLLNENGVIFISIDDNEQSQLKMLCDEVFGEGNFICDFIRKCKAGAGHDAKEISIEFDYMLFYAKNKQSIEISKEIIDTESDKKYKLVDEYVKKRGKYYLRDLDYKGSYSALSDYPIKLSNGKELFSGGKFGKPNTWRWGKTKFEWGVENDFIVIDEIKEKVYIKQYQFVDNEDKIRERSLPHRALISFLNSDGSSEIRNIIEQNIFTYPKPTSLLRFCLNLLPNKNLIILDFFAGSGTTLHATMQLNAEDGGNRQCILVTNNENNICEDVTYERNKRVIEGYTNAKGVFVEGLGNNNLRYYQCGFVSRSEEIKYKKELVLLATDLLCIKENCYELSALSTPTDLLRVYVSEKSQFLVIYDEDEISTSIAIIQQLQAQKQNDNPIKVYVFANGHYPFTEDFEEVLGFITLCALPDAIYKALQNVLPTKERPILGLEEENNENNGLGGLFSSV